MSDRKGILLVLFDLPTSTTEKRRYYYHFRKCLLQNGYLPLQESCYIKQVHNISSAPDEIKQLKKHAPVEGSVQVLPMNLNVFMNMQSLIGKPYDFSKYTEDIMVFAE